jgi:hypothetical protein
VILDFAENSLAYFSSVIAEVIAGICHFVNVIKPFFSSLTDSGTKQVSVFVHG